MENQIKKISIRGRVAIGILCLEKYSEILGIETEEKVQKLLSVLWDFTSSMRLDEWEERVLELDPVSLMADAAKDKLQNLETLSVDEALAFCRFYQHLPADYLKIISCVIEIGRSNLYAGTSEYSTSSSKALLELLHIVKQNQIPSPDLGRFELSSFTESQGWGLPQDRLFWLDG